MGKGFKIFLALYVAMFLVAFMLSTKAHADVLTIDGRPDIRPIEDRDIVVIVRGFSLRLKHFGIDFACFVDTPVKATGDGEIILSRYVDGYGNCIKIKHGWVKNGKAYTAYTIYGHLAEFTKLKGQKVKKGELIALSGSTGRADGPHLHYELHDANDSPIWNGEYQKERKEESK